MYHDRFPDKAVLPVIHILSIGQVIENLNAAVDHFADGVFLIDHSSNAPAILEKLIILIREEGWFDLLWIGVNFLGVPNRRAFTSARALGLNGIWGDNAQMFSPELRMSQEYRATRRIDLGTSDDPIFFGGVVFKYQPQHEDTAVEA